MKILGLLGQRSDAENLLDHLGIDAVGWGDADLCAVVADLEGGAVVPDPVVLNDLAGLAILEDRHDDAARLLMAAAELAETVSAKMVLIERAQEQARIAWESRLKQAV